MWHKTACILCECNCGIEVRLGADGRSFERIRGDKDHPASKGYTCEKALRLDYYQNGRGERVLHPLRRRDDGTYEEIDWDTAIREVAERLGAIRDTYGGDKILYYGGGGQGNHLGGVVRGSIVQGVRRQVPVVGASRRRRAGRSGSTALMFGAPCGGSSTSARWRSSSARTRT